MAKTKLYRSSENANGRVLFIAILSGAMGLSSCSTVGILPVATNEMGPWLKVGSFVYVDGSYKSQGAFAREPDWHSFHYACDKSFAPQS